MGLPPNIKTHDREPRQVLLRIFGNTLMPLEQETPESFITGIVMENVIFTILSERKLGPRLMGVFAGGRLEEYIPVIQNSNMHTVRNLHFLSKNSTFISRENCRFFWGEKLVKMLWFWTF